MIVNVLTELGLIKDVVGEKTAKALSKQLGLETMRDLLLHFPRRYSKRGELTSFNSLPVGEVVTVVGEVQSTNNRRMRGRKGSIFEVTLSDGEGLLTLAFFNQAWRQNELHAGVKGLFSGKIGSFSGVLQLTHPDYELFDSEIDPDKAQAWADLPIPIYPATSSMSTWRIQKAVKQVLAVAPAIEELLPEQLLQTHGLVGLSQAIHWIHEPAVDSQWQEARESLKFHEAMLLQLGLASRRAAASKEQANVYVAGALLANFDAALPFQLTDGQIAAGNEIAADLASGHPMNRMLQGEVGSGKTIVAVRAVLSAAEKGSQSALLAPTEVLASQHYRSILEALGPGRAKELGLRLLTGSQPTAERKKTMLDLASGNCRMVVGTHALISENVSFFDLGLVIIDGQHRFGVSQREALRSKASKSPHTLVMTATPIPRTLAVTVFGDLDVS
ncbi:MAG: DEAD/DEAH box helicase, partial [Aquiluna sp.]|nr:DEAD/DEAH box helicase [Aquiluna sp.]